VGHACPFLISNPSTDGSTGLQIANTAIAANASITVKACIGWKNETGLLNAEGKFPGSSGNPCRIFLPSVNYNNSYIKEIINQPQ